MTASPNFTTLRHGHARDGAMSPTYKSWQSMIGRCCRPHVHGYKNYGGRGIRVCERWMTFDHFLADMGERPSTEHTLDRKDVNGHYEPGNVRWAHKSEQANNRRVTIRLTFRGETLPIAEWCRRLGLNRRVVSQRIASGWSHEAALATPVRAWTRAA